MATKTLTDQSDRTHAASELDKNVLVIAGAGTGKTTLLIDRLIFLILGKEIPVDKIVALTFTKKAAEEMRDRLEARLRRIAGEEEPFELLEEKYPESKPKWKELATQALDDIPKAQMGTIHSFAAHLLRLYPLQAGVDPKFREDEGSVFEIVFEREWKMWAESQLGDEEGLSPFWRDILRVVSLSDLRELAEAMTSPMVDLNVLCEKDDLTAIVLSSIKELDRIQNEFTPSPRAAKFNDALKALTTLYQQVKTGKPVDLNLLGLIGRADSPPTGWEAAKEPLKRLKKRALILAEVDPELMKKVVKGLSPLVESVRQELKREGAVSFDGLLVFARNLVRDHKEVRRALKKRFATFLVDEFQDTDPLQGEILFYLAEEPGGEVSRWQDVTLGEGRLFVVGDPKQSIYRFRGADIGAFEEFQRIMEKQGALRATLSNNFRSEKRILQFVNHVFPHVMQEQAFLQPPYLALEAGRSSDGPSSPGPSVQLMTVGCKEDAEKLGADESREAEASAIAAWIKKNASDSLRYEHIALLFRSAAAFRPYLEAFRGAGIPYLAEGEKTFYRTSEVVDFLNLLSAVTDPTDTLSLVGVLRSPIGGLTDAEILELKMAGAMSFMQAPPILQDKIGPFFSVLKELNDASKKLPVPEFISQVFERTWTLETASRAGHSEQAMANLQKIRLLAEKWGESVPQTIGSFLRRFVRYRDDEKDEGENPLADVKFNAVKVMTIHKAKGLEFPVVFLPNLSAGQSGGFDKPVLERDWRSGCVGLRLRRSHKTNAAMVTVEEEIAQRELAEEVRVFYVAATRAKEKLICLVHRDGSHNGNFASYLKRAGALPNGSDALQLKDLELPVQQVFWAEEEQHAPPKISLTLPKAWDAAALKKSLEERQEECEATRSKRLFVSPSALMNEPEKKERLDEEPMVLAADPILVGQVCHKVMEEWDFKTPKKDLSKVLKKKLERAERLFELPREAPAESRVRAEASKILTTFFDSEAYSKLTQVKIIGREIPFLYPMAGAQAGAVMRGVIDLLYEDQGQWVIADYKTNRVSAATLKATVAHYAIQGNIYREALKKALGKQADFELVFLRTGQISRFI